jgi:adenosine deaminase
MFITKIINVILLNCLFCIIVQSEVTDSSVERFISLLPKIDLHTHLHGSIRQSTLFELTNFTKHSIEGENADDLDLFKCFQLFSLIHKAVTSKESLKRILNEVLEDYLQQNAIYVELRTTPRSLKDGTSLRSYVEIVMEIVSKHNEQLGHIMLVKIILSIDRTKELTEAMYVLDLAEEFAYYGNNEKNAKTIVGLDFSGHPNGNKFETYAPVFILARSKGFKFTIHCAELNDTKFETVDIDGLAVELDETSYILDLE